MSDLGATGTTGATTSITTDATVATVATPEQQQQQQPSQQPPTSFPSAKDYYKRFGNANTFISNNANPFLISPYAPRQVNGIASSSTLRTNSISPYAPSTATIQVQGNMNIAAGYSLSLNNSPLFTNQINSLSPGLGLGVSVTCINDLIDSRMEVTVGGTPVFTAGLGGIGLPNAVLTTGGASVGYVPITIGGTEYRLQIFSV